MLYTIYYISPHPSVHEAQGSEGGGVGVVTAATPRRSGRRLSQKPRLRAPCALLSPRRPGAGDEVDEGLPVLSLR